APIACGAHEADVANSETAKRILRSDALPAPSGSARGDACSGTSARVGPTHSADQTDAHSFPAAGATGTLLEDPTSECVDQSRGGGIVTGGTGQGPAGGMTLVTGGHG